MSQSAFGKLQPILNHMKNRPSTWFREGDYLEGLYTFLLGYAISAKDHAQLEGFTLGPEFSQWLVHEKGLCGDSASPWAEVIRQNEGSDTDAFEKAIALIAEYKDWPAIDGDLTK